MAWSQNAMLRDVSVTEMPRRDLNHWRSASSSVIRAIGVPQILDLGSKALGYSAQELLLPAHLFIFYFAVLADASPPVAAAAFAAALAEAAVSTE